MRFNRKNPVTNFRNRLVLLGVLFLFLLGTFIYRGYVLFIKDRQFLVDQGEARSLRKMISPAYRGMILDRNGLPLAVSTPVQSVWINPQKFEAKASQLRALAKLLAVTPNYLNRRIKHAKNREFLYLKRQISPEEISAFQALDITGINFQREYRRYYPAGEVTAQLVGITNVDDEGQEGLESAYNDWLKGTPGSQWVLKDRLGQVLKHIEQIAEPKPGRDLRLSIDLRLQYVAYRALKETVLEHHASAGSLIILDAKTGEILANVNQPSANPNQRAGLKANALRNRAVTDMYEPASTLKAFTVAAALSEGKFTPQTVIDTNPGRMLLDGRLVKDIRNYGTLTLTEAIKKSSNIGIAHVMLGTSPETVYRFLKAFGFSAYPGTHFPGEAAGWINLNGKKDRFSLATLGFGYGISVSVLQLANAYAVFANNGVYHPMTFLQQSMPSSGQRIIDKALSKSVLDMLHQVVTAEGSGHAAQVLRYDFAGKTGTARLISNNSYQDDRHNSLFVGLAPYPNPRYVLAVSIYDPKSDGYYGGQVAAPVFSKVMSVMLPLMGVPPKPEALS